MHMEDAVEEEEMLKSFLEDSHVGSAQARKESVSGALGGPLTFPDFVSPLIHVRSFQHSYVSMLMVGKSFEGMPSYPVSGDHFSL